MRDKSDMSYWWPRLCECGVPVPATALFDLGPDWHRLIDFWSKPGQHGFDQGRHKEACVLMGDLVGFLAYQAPEAVGGFPYFLRTGQTSGKHAWRYCSVVAKQDDIPERVMNLVNYSCDADFFGLPWRYWAARELLPVNPLATLPRYGDLPLVPELRAFVQGGIVRCIHRYWPAGAIQDGLALTPHAGPKTLSLAAMLGEIRPEPSPQAERLAQAADARLHDGCVPILKEVAAAFADDGAWSIDLLLTARGLVAIDMAQAHQSYHEESCCNFKELSECPTPPSPA